MFPKRPSVKETEDDLLKEQNKLFGNRKNANKIGANDPQGDANEENSKKSKDNHGIIDQEIKIIERNIPLDIPLKPEQETSQSLTDKGFPQAQILTDSDQIQTKQTRPFTRLSLYAKKFAKKKKENVDCVDENEDFSQDLVTGIGLNSENWHQDIAEIKMKNKNLIENMSREEIEKERQEVIRKLNPKTVEFLKRRKLGHRSQITSEIYKTMDKSQNNSVNDSKAEIEIIKEKIPIKLEEFKSKKYLHMDVIEKEKLDWIGDIKEESKEKKLPDSSLAARFDFEGELIDSDSSTTIDVHQGLHHHAEEPDRAGYTINELFTYLQSSYPSQKQIGLKTFEKIIGKAYLGYYDSCFNTNLIEYLIKDSPLILVVRTCLDETTETVWKSAINTLRALLCNTVCDEFFLDRGYLVFEDYLNLKYQINLNLKPSVDVELDEEISDQQYLMYDAIGCILNRTSILERFAYLIKNHLINDSDLPFIENIFDILIRLARHSEESSEKILKSKDLMDVIFSKMITSNCSINKINMVHAKIFKLLRVCISSIHPHPKVSFNKVRTLPTILIGLFNKLYDISLIESLNFCFLLVPEDAHHRQIEKIIPIVSIESLRLWIKLLSFGYNCSHKLIEAIRENFFQMSSPLIKILNFCKNLKPSELSSQNVQISSTFDFQFASHIFLLFKMYDELLGQSLNFENVLNRFDMYDIAMKWFNIIHQESFVPNFDCNLCLLILTQFILAHKELIDIDFGRLTVEKLMGQNQVFIKKFYQCCVEYSNIIHLKKKKLIPGTVRDSSNLPSYGSIYYEKIQSVPIFNENSPILLLQCLIMIAKYPFIDYEMLKNNSAIETFDQLFKYVDLITESISENFSSNIFDLIELNIVAQACMVIGTILYDHEYFEDYFFECSNSIVNFSFIIHVINDNLIKYDFIRVCLFNNAFYYSNEEDFPMIRKTYRTYSKFDHCYWIFDPIINQFKTNAKTEIEKSESETKDDYDVEYNPNKKIELMQLLYCLKFIEFIHKHYPNLFLKAKITDSLLFEVLSTVFLIDEDFFSDNDLRIIMEDFLKRFFHISEATVINYQCKQRIKKYFKPCYPSKKRIDFWNQQSKTMVPRVQCVKCSIDDNLPRLGNIRDIFDKFVDQFANTSYYDRDFYNYLFVFLQPKCSPYFRIRFLSEYFCKLMFNFKIDELILPIDSLLQPVESDLEVLEIYLKTLLSETVSSPEKSVLYRMMVFHLNHSLFREDSSIRLKLFENGKIESPIAHQNLKEQQSKFNKLIRSVEKSNNMQLKNYLKNYFPKLT